MPATCDPDTVSLLDHLAAAQREFLKGAVDMSTRVKARTYTTAELDTAVDELETAARELARFTESILARVQ